MNNKKESPSKILIVEPLAEAFETQNMLVNFASTQIAQSYQLAEQLMITSAPDLVLLEITLDSITNEGIHFAHKINTSYQLPFIFLTSCSDPKIIEEALKQHPKAYFIKPITKVQLTTTIEIILERTDHRSDLNSRSDFRFQSFDDHLFLKKESVYHRVKLDDIIRLEANDNYTVIFTRDDKFLYSTVLRKIEQQLPKSKFLRVHRSHVVNLNAIDGFEGNSLFIRDKRIPVSKGYKKLVFSKFCVFDPPKKRNMDHPSAD